MNESPIHITLTQMYGMYTLHTSVITELMHYNALIKAGTPLTYVIAWLCGSVG